jgi:hypothetical protein
MAWDTKDLYTNFGVLLDMVNANYASITSDPERRAFYEKGRGMLFAAYDLITGIVD